MDCAGISHVGFPSFRRRVTVKATSKSAEPPSHSRSDSVVPFASSSPVISNEVAADEKIVEVGVDFEKLGKELEGAGTLEIMDKALEMFGDDIAIAFRYNILFFNFKISGC